MYWELPTYIAKTGTFPKQLPMMAVRMGDWKAFDPKRMRRSNFTVMARIETYLKAARTEPLPQKEPPNPDWHF